MLLFQKANIGFRKTIKMIEMGGNVGFLRQQSQNRQHRGLAAKQKLKTPGNS